MTVPLPTPIYHVTHWKNLASIVGQGCIWSLHELKRHGVKHNDIAFDHIQERRENTLVYSAKGGCLHDYASFHFCRKSPMLYTISKGNVPNHAEGQASLIYVVSSAQAVANAGIPFTFTDGHATMAFTEFFDDLSKLSRVDWSVVNGQYWNDTAEYPDRKRRRQAEFLVYSGLAWSLVDEIATFNAGIQQEVMDIIEPMKHQPAVNVRRDWYY